MGNVLVRSSLLLLIFFFMANGSSWAATYIANKDGTVTDTLHGLMWQKSDDGVERAWKDAGQYCEDLNLAGYTDWRLPSINLLEGLIETANSPTAPSVFSIKPSYYWSASESLNNPQSAKYVNFFYGNTYAYSKDNTYYVLCVRDAARTQANNLTASFLETASDTPPFNVHFSSVITGGSAPYFIEWDFGDGETSSSITPDHVFTAPGTYKVLLTVSDNDGTVTSASKNLVLPKKEEGTAEEKTQTALPETEQPIAAGSDKIAPLASLSEKEAKEAAGSLSANNSADQKTPLGHAVKALPAGKTEAAAIETEIPSETDLQPSAASIKAADKAPDLSAVTSPVNDEARRDLTSTDITSSAALPASAPEKPVSPPAPAVTDLVKKIVRPSMEVSVRVKDPATISALGHDLLAYAFGNAMQGDADWNKDGEITARELKGYLSTAVENLSQGTTRPVINLSGDDFGVCASHGTTYLLAVGVDLYQDAFVPQPFVKQDVAAIQQAIAGKCSDSKTMVLTGEHANRAEFLQALKKIGGLLGPNDRLIFYFAGDSKRQGRRLNLLFNDTIKGMTAFTGLFYEDIAAFMKGVPGTGAIILLEIGDGGGADLQPAK